MSSSTAFILDNSRIKNKNKNSFINNTTVAYVVKSGIMKYNDNYFNNTRRGYFPQTVYIITKYDCCCYHNKDNVIWVER